MKKYVLHPGWVRSRIDGDRHYISPFRLAELYGVPLNECCVAGLHAISRCKNMKHLYVRLDGNYRRVKDG